MITIKNNAQIEKMRLAGRAAAEVYGERGALATDVCGLLGRD